MSETLTTFARFSTDVNDSTFNSILKQIGAMSALSLLPLDEHDFVRATLIQGLENDGDWKRVRVTQYLDEHTRSLVAHFKEGPFSTSSPGAPVVALEVRRAPKVSAIIAMSVKFDQLALRVLDERGEEILSINGEEVEPLSTADIRSIAAIYRRWLLAN